MEAGLAGAVAQFGVAGLIGWMWLTERRASAARERQLSEAHDRLARERISVETLVGVVSANTRALAGVEAGLRELTGAMARLRSAAGQTRRGGSGRAEGGRPL